MLFGAGFVLAGILIGAVMTAIFWPASPSVPANRIVESVQIGTASYTPPAVDASEAYDLSSTFKAVAGTVTPAVVSITASGTGGIDLPDDGFHEFDEEDLRDSFQQSSAGSGVLISDRGHIVTNYHVIQNAQDISVLLNDNREFDANIVGYDVTTDLAIIQVPPSTPDLPIIALGDSDQLEVGDWVLAIGNPFRLNSTVTAGIVSALGRDVNIIDDANSGFGVEDFIQTDAAINPGNSGGALVNLAGQLIGINTAIATERGTYEGYGFAVPVNLATHVANDLIAYGEVRRGYLGVEIQPVDARTARARGLESVSGVLIYNVGDGGAKRAGIEAGDIILEVDGRPVNAPNQLQSRVALHHPGDTLNVLVWRDGEEFLVNPILGDLQRARQATSIPRPELPAPSTAPFEELSEWGIGLREIAPAEAEAFGVTEGAYVAVIIGGSAASLYGMPRDSIVRSIDGVPVLELQDALRSFDLAYAGQEATVLVEVLRRDNTTAFYEIRVPEMD
ncbi:MAG: trypsin-like peptidase domain-containing protein [Bacteroidota bacterium]